MKLNKSETLYVTPIEDITVPMTVDYTITESGRRTYTLEETKAIIAYMREHDVGLEDALYDLIDEGVIEDYPESGSAYSDYETTYEPQFYTEEFER